jgi:magnesium-protoporphyrin O-methyltransferase
MPCGCSDCKTAGFFDEQLARKELRKYHRAGPRETTKRLIALLRAAGAGGTLLDIGCGTGILTFELLGAGFSSATCIDAAPASLAAGRAEATRRGVGERITWTEGDFVELASSVASADAVTLDRVVCCYPAYRPLLEEAAAHGRRYLALVYPRDRWFVRLFLRLENLWLKLRGSEFRAHLHPPRAIDEVLRRSGLTAAGSSETLAWEVRLYERTQT